MRVSRETGRGVRALAIAACAELVMVAAAVASVGASASGRGGDPRARAARTLDGTDTAHLHLVHQDEALLYEEGGASGVVPGQMRARLRVGPLFSGTFTIHTSRGSIAGHGSATPHGVGRYQSFHGTLLIIGGSGRYRRVHGRTQLYGTFDRRTFAVVVQTAGRLSY